MASDEIFQQSGYVLHCNDLLNILGDVDILGSSKAFHCIVAIVEHILFGRRLEKPSLEHALAQAGPRGVQHT